MDNVIETVPPNVSAEERWIVERIIVAVRVEYRATSEDTADTYIHMTDWNGKTACWRDSTFNKIAELALGFNSCAKPRRGVKERVESRVKYEKKHAEELAQYERLKKKFGAKENTNAP